MGSIYYKYDSSFVDTLVTQIPTQYNSDQYGSACWVYNSKLPYGVELDGLKSATNIEIRMYINYLDNQSGFLRIEYDSDNVLNYGTIVEYLNDNIWKSAVYSFVGRLNNLIDPGDFQLFSCSTEGTTADQNITVRKVGLYLKHIGAIATWQADGVEPVTRESFFGIVSGGASTRIIAVKDPVDAGMAYSGMVCYGTTDPIYFRVGEDTDTYWRTTSGLISTIDLTYFDNGTDDIEVSYYTDVQEHTDVVVTKGDTDTWLETSITIEPIPAGADADFNVSSDTTNASDPIIDSGVNALSLVMNGTPEPAHDPTEPKLGDSSIEFDGSNNVFVASADTGFLDFGTAAFTVMLWFNSTGTYHQNIITNNPDGTYNGFMLHIYYDDFYVYGVDGNRWEVNSAAHGIDMNDGTWHHIALSSDGAGNLYLWLDGTQYFTRTYTTMNYSATHGFYIGKDAWGYTGHMQDIYVNNGTALFTDSFSLPTLLMKDDPVYSVGAETSIRYNGEYTSYDADMKLETSAGSQLYVSSMDITLANNAIGIWRP